MRVEEFCLYVVVALVLYRLGRSLLDWVRRARVSPDPWDASVAAALDDPNCPEVCHNCFAPQEHQGWFCPECGAVVGPYASCLPGVYIFSVGEVSRNGVSHRLRSSALIVIGYLLLPVWPCGVFAPVYWYFWAKNRRRQGDANQTPEEPGAQIGSAGSPNGVGTTPQT